MEEKNLFEKSFESVNAKFIREQLSSNRLFVIGAVCPKCNATNFINSYIETDDGYKCRCCGFIVKKEVS